MSAVEDNDNLQMVRVKDSATMMTLSFCGNFYSERPVGLFGFFVLRPAVHVVQPSSTKLVKFLDIYVASWESRGIGTKNCSQQGFLFKPSSSKECLNLFLCAVMIVWFAHLRTVIVCDLTPM
jgi:hypothetical protein